MFSVDPKRKVQINMSVDNPDTSVTQTLVSLYIYEFWP